MSQTTFQTPKKLFAWLSTLISKFCEKQHSGIIRDLMNMDVCISIIDNMHILFKNEKQLHDYKNDLPLSSLFHMKITVSVTKSSHQDCGPCAIYTYLFLSFIYTLLFSSKMKIWCYIRQFSLNMFSFNQYCFTLS